MTAWNACQVCGHLTRGTRCTARPAPPAEATACDPAGWVRLARIALQAHPACQVCSRRGHLQAALTPRAWARRTAGLPVRLVDVIVLCEWHAESVGNPRPGTARFAAWTDHDGDLDSSRPDPTISNHDRKA